MAQTTPSYLGPGFSAERVITSRRKNGEKGWKEKGRQEAVVAVPPAPGVLSNDTPSFLQIARSRSRELAPRRAVPSRASANVPGGRCLAVDASNGSRNLTHERGEVSNGEKRRKEKGRQEALVPFQEAVLIGSPPRFSMSDSTASHYWTPSQIRTPLITSH